MINICLLTFLIISQPVNVVDFPTQKGIIRRKYGFELSINNEKVKNWK